MKCEKCGKYAYTKHVRVRICPNPNHKCVIDAEQLYSLLEELEVDEDIINNVRKSLSGRTGKTGSEIYSEFNNHPKLSTIFAIKNV